MTMIFSNLIMNTHLDLWP